VAAVADPEPLGEKRQVVLIADEQIRVRVDVKPLSAFVERMAGRGVVVAVYSEFGRRVRANASEGADHGTASNILLAGDGIPGGMYGEAPSLTDLDDGDLKYTVDFRDVYALLLHDVLGTDPAPTLNGWTGRLTFN
jgi:uncharacterized protein (DUF1501 family)